MTHSDTIEQHRIPVAANILARSSEMMAALLCAEALFQPSRFWLDIGRQNEALLLSHGLVNFKRSLAQNYFNWAVEGPGDPQMRGLLAAWAVEPYGMPLEAELLGEAAVFSINDTSFLRTPAAARGYTLFVGLLWWRATQGDVSGWAGGLSEPSVGNPIPIRLGGRAISQDLANSLREYHRIEALMAPSDDEPRPILAEIGSGYGRFGYVALSVRPCRYWIFDIAPALAVAEWYLSTVFPDRTVFRWRPFSRWEEVAEEAMAADIALFSIDQLPLVPDGAVRNFSAISALHEMRPEQIDAFMTLMAAKASSIYTKNWTTWRNEHDAFDFASERLVAPEGWDAAFDRGDDVIPAFTEKLFLRR